MIKKRHGVFETNSSAVHCLVMPCNYLEEPELRTTKDNRIVVGFLSDMNTYLSTQEEKLSYLITQIAYQNCAYNWRTIEEDWEFKTVSEYVCEYTGAKGIKIDYSTEPGINHQAQWGNYSIKQFVDTCDKDSVISFVFSPMMVKEYFD